MKSIGDLASEVISQAAALSDHQLQTKPKSTTIAQPQRNPVHEGAAPQPCNWKEAYIAIRTKGEQQAQQ